MKVALRLILVLIGLALLGCGLLLMAVGLNMLPEIWTNIFWLSENMAVFIGAGLAVLALLLLVFGLRPSPKPVETVLQRNELGEIRIALVALENMVLRVTQQHNGIKESKRRVVQTPDGLVAFLRVKVMPDLELPALISELQRKIKKYIEEITGIGVVGVKVLVENVVTDLIAQRKH